MVPLAATVASEAPPRDFDEVEFLEAWDPEVRRRSGRSSRQSGLGECEADDIAQEVRVALLLAVRKKRKLLGEKYVRRITSNVLRSEWRKRNRVDSHQVPIDQIRDEVASEPPNQPDPLLRRRVQSLSPPLKTVFDSIYRLGYS